jgi:MFS family permease
MIVATISNIIEGALSDRTVSRIGKRNPWIIFGCVATLICFFILTKVTSIRSIIIIWVFYQIALNMMVAPLVAFIADKAPKEYRGTISSFYGVGMNIGNSLSTIIASRFIDHINSGIYLLMVFQIIFVLVGLLLIGDGSNKGDKRDKLNAKQLAEAFMFPIHGEIRDFYLAVVGKLLFVSAHYVIVGYQLYIFTDYMRLSSDNAASNLSIMSTILLIMGVSFAIVGGPLADKFHSLKLLVALSTFVLGIGVVFPMVDPAPWTMFAYALFGGAAMGMYQSVDQALNVTVLPSQNNAAKDLGIVNLANSLGHIIGPVVASVIIGLLGYRGIFPVAGIMCLIGGILILMIKKVK